MLGKSGTKFDEVIQHLRQTPLGLLSQQYAQLRVHLVTHQLQHLESRLNVFLQSTETPPNTLLDQQLCIADLPSASDAMLEIVDDMRCSESDLWTYVGTSQLW